MRADLVEVVVFLRLEQVERLPLILAGSSQQVVKNVVVPTHDTPPVSKRVSGHLTKHVDKQRASSARTVIRPTCGLFRSSQKRLPKGRVTGHVTQTGRDSRGHRLLPFVVLLVDQTRFLQ